MTNIPVTMATRLTPVSGQEEKLRCWFEAIASDASRFDGHLGSELFQAIANQGDPLWLSLFTFDTPEHLDAWMKSEVRANRLATGADLFAGNVRRQPMVGIEFWFDNLDQPGALPPPKWKMALVSGVVILLLSNSVMSWFSAGMQRLQAPIWITNTCSVGLMISVMTWVIMPWASRMLHRWLTYRNRR